MPRAFSWVSKPEEPLPSESLVSYLRHFARDNFFGSRRELLRAVEISPAIRIDATEVHRLAAVLGVPIAKVEAMAPSDTPAVPALRRSLTRTQGEPVCPICLSEASYSRRLWSHQLATACPKHSVELVEECPGCCARLRSDRSLAHICDCGYDWRRVEPKAADPIELEVAALLERRVPMGALLPLDLSSGVPGDIDLFLVEFIYHFGFELEQARPQKISGATPTPRLLEQARAGVLAVARVTSNWPETFSGVVSKLMETESPRQGEATVAARLGSWYKFLFRRYRHPAYGAFRTAAANTIVLEHDGPIDVRNREILSVCTVKKDWLTLTEAGRELGVSGMRLARGVDDGRVQAFIPKTGYKRAITRAELGRLRNVRSGYWDKQTAAGFLGVPKSLFRVLAEAGLFTIHDAASLPPVTVGCVSKLELLALADRLFSGLEHIGEPGGKYVPMRDLNLRRTTDRQRLVTLCRSIGDGSFQLSGHDGTGGLGGILLAKKKVEERIASYSVGYQLNVQQVSELVGVHYDAVKAWIDTGLLCGRQTEQQGTPYVVELRDLVRFLLEYSPLSNLASQMGSSSRGVTAALEHRRVQCLRPSEHRGGLVRIRDMVRMHTGGC